MYGSSTLNKNRKNAQIIAALIIVEGINPHSAHFRASSASRLARLLSPLINASKDFFECRSPKSAK